MSALCTRNHLPLRKCSEISKLNSNTIEEFLLAFFILDILHTSNDV